MEAIADAVNSFLESTLEDLPDFDAIWADSMMDVLCGDIHGVSKKGPSEEEQKFILPLIAIIGTLKNNAIDTLLTHNKNNDQAKAFYIYLKTFEKMNKHHLHPILYPDINPPTLSITLSSKVNKTAQNTSNMIILAKKRFEKHLPAQFNYDSLDIQSMQGSLKQFLETKSNLPPEKMIATPLPQTTITFFPSHIHSAIDANQIVDRIFRELRAFEQAFIKEGKDDDYKEIIGHIKTIQSLWNEKDHIMAYAKDVWSKIERGEDIPSKNYTWPIKVTKGSSESFRAVIEDYAVFLQNRLGVSYMPVFENPSYMSLADVLPTDAIEKEVAFATLETHLTDGVKMLHQALLWLEKNPLYFRDFFYNAFSHGGCIPARNVTLANWILLRVKNQPSEYVYDKLLMHGDFYMKLGRLVTFFSNDCIQKTLETHPHMIASSLADIEKTSEYKNYFTEDNFIPWVQKIVQSAYEGKGWWNFFQGSEFNNISEIREGLKIISIF
ncbi:MAG: hypothetical protein K2X98_01590 [Alphaproteobacteria bacterium]|nr:hypothetical protein [Alphaproteobacteria bacterium]